MRLKKLEKNISDKSTSVSSGKSVIGLDIGEHAIRMVQVSGKQPTQVQLEKYAVEYLSPNVISGGEITDFDQLVAHLQQCYSKLKTNCKQINVALPLSVVTVQENLRFDPEHSEISLQDYVEAEVLSFGSLEEMNYDWEILSEDASTREQTVLMVAAKTESVNQYTDVVDELRATAINVDVDLFAVANAFIFADAVGSSEFSYTQVAIFDVGDNTMKALIMEGGQILYKQESSVGFEHLLQMIRRDYQVSDEEALDMALGAISRPNDYKDLVENPFNLQIAQEIQRTIQLFIATQNVGISSDIKQIFISGSGCVSAELGEFLTKQIGITTHQIAPVALAINKTKLGREQLEKDANSLTTAFGLALRGLSTK